MKILNREVKIQVLTFLVHPVGLTCVAPRERPLAFITNILEL